MLSPYRSRPVDARRDGLRRSTGFVARLPISMVTLGIVLLVVGRTGSYGQAGAVSAAYMIGDGCRRDRCWPG